MPIRPENLKDYLKPKHWKVIRENILKRAKNKCEFCGIRNYTIRKNGSKVVLTIAHLDHNPKNNSKGNLRAWCQKHHNLYDANHRIEGMRERGTL